MKSVFIYGEKDKLKNYCVTLKQLNAKPIVSTDIQKSKNADCLLLPGGGDICPCLYNSINYGLSKDVDLERDIKEQYLIYCFIKSHKPILGICRGLQIINVYFGGTINQNIENLSVHQKPHCDTWHNTVNNSSFMKNLFGKISVINSNHHQCIDILGHSLKICAKSPDGVIEAIENKELKISAVQFHPERMKGEALKIIDNFLHL